MISRLRGLIAEKGADFVLIDVGGVGYYVACSSRTSEALPKVGQEALLFTEMLVSENSLSLVGFLTATERDWFRLLDGVQGVGTRVALAILSTLSINELAHALAVGEKAAVMRAPGVGPKVAQRIINELKDKIPSLSFVQFARGEGNFEGENRGIASPAEKDAVSALVNLGYSRAQAVGAVCIARDKGGADADRTMLIRLALKDMSQ